MEQTRAREQQLRDEQAISSRSDGVVGATAAQAAERRVPVGHDEEMPRISITRQQAVAFGLFIVSGVAFLYFVLPKLAGIGTTVRRIERGDTWWIVLAFVFEILSFARLRCVVPRACSCAAAGGSACARATRSRWLGWRRRGCLRQRAPAASR